ncbi:MAG: IS66 family insertion sequence element accessory protein TnpB [Herminiimonas sp.]|nr:IS66 family insertion sequence element accessory protein TnpB [Herminiimonas sp.]
MFFPEGQVRVFLYGQPVNMRLSFDGLYALAKHVMLQDPSSGNLFTSINRRATQIRVLYFDRNGLWVWAKRLEQGRLVSKWADVASCEMDWTGQKLLLEGIEPKQVRRRYEKPVIQSQNTPIYPAKNL